MQNHSPYWKPSGGRAFKPVQAVSNRALYIIYAAVHNKIFVSMQYAGSVQYIVMYTKVCIILHALPRHSSIHICI